MLARPPTCQSLWKVSSKTSLDEPAIWNLLIVWLHAIHMRSNQRTNLPNFHDYTTYLFELQTVLLLIIRNIQSNQSIQILNELHKLVWFRFGIEHLELVDRNYEMGVSQSNGMFTKCLSKHFQCKLSERYQLNTSFHTEVNSICMQTNKCICILIERFFFYSILWFCTISECFPEFHSISITLLNWFFSLYDWNCSRFDSIIFNGNFFPELILYGSFINLFMMSIIFDYEQQAIDFKIIPLKYFKFKKSILPLLYLCRSLNWYFHSSNEIAFW